jgi:hypothetical protein
LDCTTAQSPDRIQPISATLIDKVDELVKDIEVDDDEVFPDDVSL